MDMTPAILCDKNCEGHATAIQHALIRKGYVDLLNIEFAVFEDVGLHKKARDEEVWTFCQNQGYLLLTGNRTTTDGDESLEVVTQRLLTENSLPVLTIGDLDRVLKDREYCDLCAETIATIILDLERRYLGTPRIFIPF
jgi:hypothetical protein